MKDEFSFVNISKQYDTDKSMNKQINGTEREFSDRSQYVLKQIKKTVQFKW